MRRWALSTAAGLMGLIGTAFAQPDSVKIRNFTADGWAEGVVTERNLEQGWERSEETRNGIATFHHPYEPDGVEKHEQVTSALFPNPVTDQATLRLGREARKHPVTVTNTLGQIIATIQPGQDHLTLNTRPGVYLFTTKDDDGKHEARKAVLLDGTADVTITTTDKDALKAAAFTKDYRYTYQDPTKNYATNSVEVYLAYYDGQDVATFDISPIVLAEKRVGVTGRIVGADALSFTKPGTQNVTLEEDGTFPEQAWVEAYDNREAYPYAFTANGGERYPHAVPATFTGPLFQDSTVTVADTLRQQYTVAGTTTPGTRIDVRAFPDSARSLASITATFSSYRLDEEWKLLSREVLLKAVYGDETRRVRTTLTPGVNTHDFLFTAVERTMYFRGPTSRNATINLSTGGVLQADNEGNVFGSVTTTHGQVLLSYEAPHADGEEQSLPVIDADTVDLLILNTHYDAFIDADNEIAFTYSGAGRTDTGFGGDTLRLATRANSLEARLRGTAEDLVSIDETYDMPAGLTTLSPEASWQYVVAMANTEAGSSITGRINTIVKYTATGTGGVVDSPRFTHTAKTALLNVRQAKEGKNPTDQDFTVAKGENGVTLVDMTDVTNPLETFYIDAGTTTRNATITIKDGTQTVATITADNNGYVSSRSIDWQLDNGKDLILQYAAPSADNENITKTDVDDEEHVSIAYLLNAYFPITITADDEVSWQANSKTGTGDGTANLEARANSLAVNFTASAPSADNYASSQTFSIGGGSKTITMSWVYNVAMTNTESGSALTGVFQGSQVYTASGTGGTVNKTFKRTGVKTGTLEVNQAKSGYDPNSASKTVSKGDNTIALPDMVPNINPEETFYIDAGTTTRNATITIKDGTQTVATITADNNGYVSSRSIDWQLDNGKDLILQYAAPSADNENITKTDVDDEEHVSIAHLLNAYFPITISADDEVSWQANNKTGTGDGTASLEARANNLTVNFTASAPSADNYASSQTYSIGGGSKDIVMNWIYTVNMANTESGSSITGKFNSSQVYTATGSGGTVQKVFTRSGVKSGTLNVRQTKTDYTPTDQDFSISKGTSNVTLADMVYDNPVETFHIDAGTTTRNATITIKDGTQTVATITADNNGYVSSRSIDWQLDNGKDLILQYAAPSADNENITKTDVDDEEHVSIAHLLNAYFPIAISADDEVSWQANNKTGTGDGTASLEARANNLTVNFSASAPSAENYASSQTYSIGGGSKDIVMNWIYNVAINNTENGSSLTGLFNSSQVFTSTGTGGTVNKTFKRTGVKTGTLKVDQTKSGYEPNSATKTISKGSSSITLEDMVQELVSIRFRGYTSSPTGTVINFIEGGSTVMTGTVDSEGDYTTNYYSVPSVPFTIDRVFADGPSGWIDENHYNIVASSSGNNTYEVNLEEEQQGQEYTFSGRLISINGSDFISNVTNALKFVSSYETVYASTGSGGSFSVTINADPNGTVSVSGNVSGYEEHFISVVGKDSKTGSGPAVDDPDDLDNGSLDVILGRSDIVTNSTFQSSLAYQGFYRGAFLQKTIWNYNPSTGGEAPQEFIDACTTALNSLDAAFSTPIYGKMINVSSGIDIVTGSTEPSWDGKMMIEMSEAYRNTSYNMTGHVVFAGGSSIKSLTIECEEFVMPRGEYLFFNSDGSPNESGKSRMVYAVKFGY